jgi:hypothetical protein
MEIKCKCGWTDNYSVVIKSDQAVATCNGCGAYIKNIAKKDYPFQYPSNRGLEGWKTTGTISIITKHGNPYYIGYTIDTERSDVREVLMKGAEKRREAAEPTRQQEADDNETALKILLEESKNRMAKAAWKGSLKYPQQKEEKVSQIIAKVRNFIHICRPSFWR